MDAGSSARLIAAKEAAIEAVADYARAMVEHHANEPFSYEGTYTITVTLRDNKIVGRQLTIGG